MILFFIEAIKGCSEQLFNGNYRSFPPLAEVLFESSHGDQKVALLLQYILDCLHKIFLYDTQRFLSKERADTLMMPLLDQVTHSGLFDWFWTSG